MQAVREEERQSCASDSIVTAVREEEEAGAAVTARKTGMVEATLEAVEGVADAAAGAAGTTATKSAAVVWAATAAAAMAALAEAPAAGEEAVAARALAAATGKGTIKGAARDKTSNKAPHHTFSFLCRATHAAGDACFLRAPRTSEVPPLSEGAKNPASPCMPVPACRPPSGLYQSHAAASSDDPEPPNKTRVGRSQAAPTGQWSHGTAEGTVALRMRSRTSGAVSGGTTGNMLSSPATATSVPNKPRVSRVEARVIPTIPVRVDIRYPGWRGSWWTRDKKGADGCSVSVEGPAAGDRRTPRRTGTGSFGEDPGTATPLR